MRPAAFFNILSRYINERMTLESGENKTIDAALDRLEIVVTVERSK